MTLAHRGAAWIWDHPRSEWPAWKRGWKHLGHVVEDGGNIAVAIAEQKKSGDPHAKYLKEITATCTKHAETVMKTLEAGKFPLVLGGDHSVAAGTVAGVAEFFRQQRRAQEQKIGLIWIDAHSGHQYARNVAQRQRSWHAAGRHHGAWARRNWPISIDFSPKVSPENCVLIGVRDIDMPQRKKISSNAGMEVYTMRDIDERGMRTVMEEALRIAGRGTAGYHVRSTWTGSIRKTLRAWEPRCVVARPIVKRTWPWKSSPTTAA